MRRWVWRTVPSSKKMRRFLPRASTRSTRRPTSRRHGWSLQGSSSATTRAPVSAGPRAAAMRKRVSPSGMSGALKLWYGPAGSQGARAEESGPHRIASLASRSPEQVCSHRILESRQFSVAPLESPSMPHPTWCPAVLLAASLCACAAPAPRARAGRPSVRSPYPSRPRRRPSLQRPRPKRPRRRRSKSEATRSSWTAGSSATRRASPSSAS